MSSRKKVLLMGKSGSGKTSMRSIIFANFLARETEKLNPTLEVEHSDVRFLGNLVLNLWDCGGQDNFYDNYFVSQRGHIFRNVELLIYVFDIESRELEKDFRNYEECLEALEENSSDAKIFVLVHKMDKVPEESREEVFRERTELIRSRSRSFDIFPYRTSIWDDTLYKAWASIVYSLIPNIGQLQTELETFCKTCGGDEAVLFERASFLVIANSTLQTHGDVHRFEKISNIIKQFKLSCSKSQTQFQGMTVSNSTFSATINAFTRSTYLMVIVSDPSLSLSAVKLNVDAVRERFEHLIAQSGNPALKDETASTAGGGGGEAVATAAE